VWHYLKEAMKGLPVASNKEELWEKAATFQYMWSPEMTEKIKALYESLPNRILTVIAARGGNTSY
jgi:hypothetical protein